MDLTIKLRADVILVGTQLSEDFEIETSISECKGKCSQIKTNYLRILKQKYIHKKSEFS